MTVVMKTNTGLEYISVMGGGGTGVCSSNLAKHGVRLTLASYHKSNEKLV